MQPRLYGRTDGLSIPACSLSTGGPGGPSRRSVEQSVREDAMRFSAGVVEISSTDPRVCRGRWRLIRMIKGFNFSVAPQLGQHQECATWWHRSRQTDGQDCTRCRGRGAEAGSVPPSWISSAPRRSFTGVLQRSRPITNGNYIAEEENERNVIFRTPLAAEVAQSKG